MRIFHLSKSSLGALLGVLMLACATNAQVNDPGRDFSYALKLYNQKFYDLAAQQFIKYYSNYPTSDKADEARYYSGMSLFILKDFAKARVEFQSLALEFPKSPRSPESWFKTGECYEQLGNPSEAAKAFETVKILYPADAMAAQALLRAGINYRAAHNNSKAENVLKALRERYPGSTVYNKAALELTLVYLENGNTLDASANAQKVIDGSSDKSEQARAYFLLGQIEMNEGYVENAIGYFNTVLDRFPGSAYGDDAALAVAEAYISKGEANRVAAYTAKINAPQKQNAVHMLNADAYFLQSKYALAGSEYEKVEVENDSLELILTLKKGLALRQQSLKSKSRELLAGALLNSTDQNSSLYRKVADVYLGWLKEDGQYDQALSFIYDRFRNRSEAEGDVVHLAEVLYSARRWQNLVREISPRLVAISRHPQLDKLHYYLAVAYKERGQYSECAYHLDQILKQFAASSYYQKADELYSEVLSYNLVDGDQTLKSVVRLIAQMDNSRQDLAFQLGKVYFSDLKEYENARAEFEEALQKSSNTGDVHLYMGKTFIKLAEKEKEDSQRKEVLMRKAAESFTKAVENLNTCSAPDEASWLMVQTKINVDTVSVEKQKSYLEALVKKFPKSGLREQWLESLAHTLAFDTRYVEQAENYFKELISSFKNSPRYPAYLFGYARLKKSEQPTLALEVYKQIALNYSDSRFAVLALQEVIQSYIDEGQYDQALQLSERMTNMYFYSPQARQAEEHMGRLTFRAGQYHETVAALKEKVKDPFRNDVVLSRAFLDEAFFSRMVYLGLAHARLGQTERAQGLLSDYLRATPAGNLRDMVSFELAELYRAQGQWGLALNYYEKVSREDKQLYGQARLAAADLYFESDAYDKAANIYQELGGIFKGHQAEKEIRGKFVICKIKTGAIAESEKQIQLYKRDFSDEQDYLARFTLELGDYQRRNKNFDRAIKSFRTVKRSYSRSSSVDDAEYYTALTYITLNKYEEALDILTAFEKNYPESDRIPSALNTLGGLYFQTEKYDVAIATFKRALQLSSDRSLRGQIMSNLIKTYSLTGFWDAAQGMAREYIEEYPRAADRLDKKLIIAQAFIHLNQFQNAVDYLKTIKLDADSEREPEIQFYIGEAYLKAGQYEEAIAEFVKIPLMSKKTKLQWEASALYYSGQAYEKLGRISDAVRMYREIIERPGIDLILKRDAEKRINQIQG